MARMVDLVKKIKTADIIGPDVTDLSPMAAPRITKVVLNSGLGRALISASQPKELLEKSQEELSLIAGQRAVVTKAHISIASFKVREGQPLGLKATLRGQRMYDFLEKLVSIALPRSRDFKGIPERAVDRDGNLTIGIKEHIIFPEVAESSRALGLEISVVTSTRNREHALALFRLLGFPLQSKETAEVVEEKPKAKPKAKKK